MPWGKRVSEHHHSGVNDDLPTLSRWGRYLSPSSASVKSQGELSPISVQLQLMPISIIQAMVRQCDVIVSISKVVENSQMTLKNLKSIVMLNLRFWWGSNKTLLLETLRLLSKKLVIFDVSLYVSVNFKSVTQTVKWGDTNTNCIPAVLCCVDGQKQIVSITIS